MRAGRALIASVENVAAVFESGEAPRMAPERHELDLGGHGIRSLSYVPDLHAYPVIAGPVSRAAADFQIWRWSGLPGAPAQRLSVAGRSGLEKAEGLCPAVIGGVKKKFVIVSDDGDRKAGRAAGFLLLDANLLPPAA